MQAQVLNAQEYGIDRGELLPTPRLAVYRTRLEQNISLMRRYLESVVPGSGFRHLAPHVKTHKSAWVTRILMESGIRKFKCTLHELDMLCDAGAADILVAYPLLPHDADRVAGRVACRPSGSISAQVGCIEHADCLATAARKHGVEISCLLDLNVGQDRTGAAPEKVTDLARHIARSPHTGPLRIRGIHAYAGHNDSPDPEERAACSGRTMARVVECLKGLRQAGVSVERIVVAGTPGFMEELRELIGEHRVSAEVDVSPGTWVYWDTKYDGILPGMFEFASLILGQVIDLPAPGLATLNLGSKRWSADKGPVRLFSIPGLEVVSASEEHTVLRNTQGTKLRVGDQVLLAPHHVCTTVNLWETFTVVGEDGRVEMRSVPVDGRNR